jgi:hypothetical protein
MNIARVRVSRMWLAFPWAHSPLREAGIPCMWRQLGNARFLFGYRDRAFTTDEQQQEHPQVALLGHRLWQSRFASSREIVGESILLNGQSCTVVGVMPQTSMLVIYQEKTRGLRARSGGRALLGSGSFAAHKCLTAGGPCIPAGPDIHLLPRARRAFADD